MTNERQTLHKYALALPRAIAWSSNLLVNEFDKGGNPYILHPLWIMNRVRHRGFGHQILAATHDCPEDCFEGDIEAGLESFRINVIDDDDLVDDLRLLSHFPGDSYSTYIRKMVDSQRAVDIKLEDLDHNSMITRLKGITEKDIARIRKYHASYAFLKGDTGKLLDLVGD